MRSHPVGRLPSGSISIRPRRRLSELEAMSSQQPASLATRATVRSRNGSTARSTRASSGLSCAPRRLAPLRAHATRPMPGSRNGSQLTLLTPRSARHSGQPVVARPPAPRAATAQLAERPGVLKRGDRQMPREAALVAATQARRCPTPSPSTSACDTRTSTRRPAKRGSSE